MATAAHEAGSVSRPVFSVTSASFRPRPSPRSRFSFGTRTFVKRMTPFSIAFRPMKWQRRTTSTPGQSFSTMNAEIFLRVRVPRHHDEELRDRAVRAPELLAVEDVVALGRAGRRRRERRRIGARLRLRQRERGDRALREARQVLLLLLRRAEELQRLRHADRLVRGEQRDQVAVLARDELDRLRVLALR